MTLEELTRRLEEIHLQYEHESRHARMAYESRWRMLLTEYAEKNTEAERER